MFQSIQEGLKVYREKLKEHFQENSRVAKRERQDREQREIDYRGVADWPREDREAFDRRSHQLCGMATVLGLSNEEIKKNWEDIERELGLRR